MGNLGFLFEIDEDFYEENYFSIGEFKIENRKFVVFVSRDDLQGNYIVGRSNFRRENCDFLFLDKGNNFSRFLVFDDSLFKAAKILVSNKRAVDYKYLTFWLEAFEYKEIYNLLLIRESVKDLREQIQSRVFELYFLLYKKMKV